MGATCSYSHLALTCLLGDPMYCDLFIQTTFEGGLGHIWQLHLCSVYVNASRFTTNSSVGGATNRLSHCQKYIIVVGLFGNHAELYSSLLLG